MNDRATHRPGDATGKRPGSAMTGAALVGACLAAAAGHAAAQAPGYPPIDPRSVRAEYMAEAIDRVNEVVALWGSAWGQDDVDGLVDQYWEDATLIPPGRHPLRGHAQIREYFEEVVPRHGHVEGFMLDFDASGGMAMTYGNYMIGIQHGAGAGTQETGPLVTVYALRGRTWKIRTQAFLER